MGIAIDLAHNPRKRDFVEDVKGNREELLVNLEGNEYLMSAVKELGVRVRLGTCKEISQRVHRSWRRRSPAILEGPRSNGAALQNFRPSSLRRTGREP
jgi:hypothetical protein